MTLSFEAALKGPRLHMAWFLTNSMWQCARFQSRLQRRRSPIGLLLLEVKPTQTWKRGQFSPKAIFRSSGPGRFRQLLDDVKFDLCNTRSNHSQRLGRGIGDIDNSSGNVRTAVIDPNCHRFSTGDVRHAQPCAEWQRRMSGGQIVRIEFFAARCLCTLRIEAGQSLRSSFCLGSIVVRGGRRVPFYGRETSVNEQWCRSIVLQRRLSTGAN
jgi:hypothetical protein